MEVLRPRFVSISSLSSSDKEELFKFICSSILHREELRVKEQVLAIDGSIDYLKSYEITMSDIFKVIEFYDLEFELLVKYAEPIEHDFELAENVSKSRVQIELDQQRKEINAEILSESIKNSVPKGMSEFKNQVLVDRFTKEPDDSENKLDLDNNLPDFD